MPPPFRDKVTIVTGASRGIGRRIATHLAAQGAKLALAARSAGATMAFRFEELRDLAIPQRLMAVNYLGSVFCTYYALPHLRASRGRLVGVASLTGRAGVPLRSLYAASKHAMAGFFDSLRIELAGTGVSVTMIYPDFVETGVRDRALGPDGRPVGIRPPAGRRFMDAATCARIVVAAAGARRREVIVGARGKIGLVLKTFAPGMVDWMARRAIANVSIGEAGSGKRDG